jgi:hypothetical protein
MKYRVRLIRAPLYATTVEVSAASLEEAKEQALAAGELSWDLAGDGPIEIDGISEITSVPRSGGRP